MRTWQGSGSRYTWVRRERVARLPQGELR